MIRSGERLTLLIVVLSLICLSSQSVYYATINSNGKYKTQFSLGRINAGYSLQINVTIPGAPQAPISLSQLTLAVDIDSYTPNPPITCTKSSTCSDISCTYTCPIVSSDNYRINMTVSGLPSSGTSLPIALQHYQLDAGIFLSTSSPATGAVVTSLLKITDVFRDRVTRLIYSKSQQTLAFSLYPIPSQSDQYERTLALYKVKEVKGTNNYYNI